MFIRIRVPSNLARNKPHNATSYPIRVRSLVASVGVHAVGVVLLLSDSPQPTHFRRPIVDELVQPNKHKIIYYDFRKKLVDVEPLKQVGKFPRPRGAESSRQTVIATAPIPKSTQQMIWVPTPKVHIQQDVPLPNLIARMKTSLPELPTLPKAKPQPSVEAAQTARPNAVPPNPKGDVNHAPEVHQEASQPPRPVRNFVPPPASRQPKLPVSVQVSEAPALAESPSSSSALPPGAGLPSALQASSIPTSIAPLALAPNAGNAKADLAVASLHPTENPDASLPAGGRPGKFSKAPETGAPASGEIGRPGAISVPNLTVREERSKPARVPPDPNRTKAVLYIDRVRSIPTSTLSVPLRPSSRTIPRAVEARFQGRNVYTMVVPIENLPTYAGDWIVWFAERQPVPGSTPLMRAPLPFRKMELIDQEPPGSAGQARVQFSAVLDKGGRLENLVILARPSTITELSVMQDLESWEFKPATRDGIPVDVEVVIEIPFNLSTSIAKRAQP